MTILETLAAHAAQRVEAAQQTLPADVLQARAQALPKGELPAPTGAGWPGAICGWSCCGRYLPLIFTQ